MNDECSYIIITTLENPHNTPLKLVSGEIPYLNNKKIRPRSAVRVSIEVPKGYREYYYAYKGLGGIPCVYVGWISDEVDEYDYE